MATDRVGNWVAVWGYDGGSTAGPQDEIFVTRWTIPVDRDADGYADNVDAFPLRPDEWADADSDGLGDNFEQLIIEHNLADGIEVLTDVLSGDDYDGDGLSNYQEFIDATDPTDPTPPLPTSGPMFELILAALLSLVGGFATYRFSQTRSTLRNAVVKF
jgi:hypothetical protein